MAKPYLPLEMTENESSVEVKGNDFKYIFDKQTGDLSSMTIQGKELVSKGLRLNVWRAPLANDLDSWNFWHTETGHVTEGMGRRPQTDGVASDLTGWSRWWMHSRVTLQTEISGFTWRPVCMP